MPVGASVINKLMLARHLFWMAGDNLKSHREVALFSAVNLLQDSVEAFLLAASEYLNAGIEARTSFDQYFVKIDERLNPKQLPFRSRLSSLNKARVLSKHNGVRPHRDELKNFAVACREFFDETCQMIFGLAFWSLGVAAGYASRQL